jgi:hypothetical protein
MVTSLTETISIHDDEVIDVDEQTSGDETMPTDVSADYVLDPFSTA